MIFAVQHFLEDHFARRGLADVDQYAIRVANVFDQQGSAVSEKVLARELSRLRTVFFRRNTGLDRREFEAALSAALRRRFPKKNDDARPPGFARSFGPARARLRRYRRSIQSLLSEFRRAVEARAVDAFWISRTKHRLRSKPEKIAQGLLAVFAKGVIGRTGLVLREVGSGVGFVDVGISFSGLLHLVELKILKGPLTGASQLATYMATEGRRSGWLVLIDARSMARSAPVPAQIAAGSGRINTLLVNVNPTAPHSM